MRINKELMKGSTAILVLSLLRDCDMYGYQMLQELKKRSGDAFDLKEGTLYPVLHGLENALAVHAYWQESSGRKRKYYRLSQKGKQLLEEKREEWNAYAKAVNQVIGGARLEG